MKTAASCFYDAFNRSVIIPTYFKVTAGKIAYSWMKPDNNAQERNVSGKLNSFIVFQRKEIGLFVC